MQRMILTVHLEHVEFESQSEVMRGQQILLQTNDAPEDSAVTKPQGFGNLSFYRISGEGCFSVDSGEQGDPHDNSRRNAERALRSGIRGRCRESWIYVCPQN
jgi:hypothetical protein